MGWPKKVERELLGMLLSPVVPVSAMGAATLAIGCLTALALSDGTLLTLTAASSVVTVLQLGVMVLYRMRPHLIDVSRWRTLYASIACVHALALGLIGAQIMLAPVSDYRMLMLAATFSYAAGVVVRGSVLRWMCMSCLALAVLPVAAALALGSRIDIGVSVLLVAMMITSFETVQTAYIATVELLVTRAKSVQLAGLDFLTGVSNRFSFEAYLDATLSDPNFSKTALHFIDLDRFKEVNDLHGHPVGDKVLVEVAARLSRLVREGDRIARVGGDEFVIVQKAVSSREAASAMGAHVVEALSAPFLIDGLCIDIGASVGIAVAPDDAETRRPLVAKADAALYRAKRSTRGMVIMAS